MLNLEQRGFYKGVNLGGWFSQCDYHPEKMDHFITEQDFKIISAWGLDHVRIPIDYNILELNDGLLRIDKAIAMCKAYGLHTVLDLHKTKGFSFDNYAEHEEGFFENKIYQEHFYNIWECFAQRYGQDSQQVAFELLNEVTEKYYLPAWNEIADTCIQRIRTFAPDVLILVGSYENNSPETVKYLNPPYDPHVIYNMHCYEPLKFTHQGAYWTDKINPDERFRFSEINITENYFEQLFASAIVKAQENHTVLYCGEYGMIDRAEPEDILKWFQVIHSVFETYNIGRCAWNYKELDFGLSNPRLNGIREELLKNL
ncbi:MAG: glycoside hydrolase family 5 protein [Oscillospiraceae bacterium]|nr:glycoside hydrolase family 5 protein [Oscillospiraceae bacterium]